MTGQVNIDKSSVMQSLQALTRGEGVQRPALIESLRKELRPLQRIWAIDLDRTLPHVRHVISANVRALIHQVAPRPARQERSTTVRREQFEHAISVSFNILDDPDLRSMSLQDRREWLAKEAPKGLQIKVKTSQRDLEYAINAMAERLTSPAYLPVKDSDAIALPANAGEPPEEENQQIRSAPSRPDAIPIRSKKRIVVAVASTIVLAAAALVTLTALDSDDCEPNDPQCTPVSVQVETDLDRVTPGVPVGAYLFKPATFADLPNKASCGQGYQLQEWAQQHGGRSAFLQYIKVSLTAHEKPVLVTYAEAVVSKLPSTPGDIASCQDGAQLTVRYLEVDLEKKTTTYYSELDPMTGSVPEPLALRIEPGESEVLIVSVIAAPTDATWHLKLGMDVEGRRVEQLVQDDGEDFFLGGKDTRGRPVYTEQGPNTWATN